MTQELKPTDWAESIATAIDTEWRAKGGLNCTEVCAIVRSAPRPSADADAAGVVEEARFLIERLDDFEQGSLGDDIEDACRDFDGHVSPAIERLRSALVASQAPAGEPVAMTAIDPDAWEPCSPAYIEGGGLCSAPRVWNEAERNHYHPKRGAQPPAPVVTDAMVEAALAVKPIGLFWPGSTAEESEDQNRQYFGADRMRAALTAALTTKAEQP